MRSTLNIDDKAISTAARLTGVHRKSELGRMGIEALIARESARRLAALGGSAPKVRPVPRRRPADPAGMVLPHTSAWIDHLRHGDARVVAARRRGGRLPSARHG